MMNKRFWFVLPILVIAILAIREYRNRPVYTFIPKDVQVTIPEGTNIADIDRILSRSGIVASGSFLKPEYLQYEGFLFPDTYRLDKNSSIEVVVKILRDNYDRRIKESNLNPSREDIIVASMLEKEVQTAEDMRIVAGIIKKRKEIGMALQIDATVAYSACLKIWSAGDYCDSSKVSIVDNIPRDTAYNTYSNRGLPSGAISNPGIGAIRAALNPQSSEYLFYLSAKDGRTIFSRTLEEHNRARAKYL